MNKTGMSIFIWLLLTCSPAILFSESIPYDASLALANIVPPGKLEQLQKIGTLNQQIDSAEENLNMQTFNLRSLNMTVMELSNMNINPDETITTAITDAKKAVEEAAKALAEIRLKNYTEIAKIKQGLNNSQINVSYESPVDYNRTQIKKMPLSADSIKMNAQYFSYGENEQNSKSAISAIRSFVSGATSFLGTNFSTEATNTAEGQANQQVENHEVLGTLVITASCTHQEAQLLAPFVLDVDKAIRVWNKMYSDSPIKPDSLKNVEEIANDDTKYADKAMTILSGATYGSSFIGMVHILKTESTQSSQDMISTASSLQAQMTTGGWFSNASGGFGVSSQFANDVKNLLSSQKISSHITMFSIGIIPTITSGEVQLGVKKFSEFDPAAMMNKLATLANATSSDQQSVQESAAAARTGGQMVALRSAEIQSVMMGLSEIDDGRNKMLDINSLMMAFEDYIKKAEAGNAGVPITYYLKPITASQLAQMWIAKYYPNKYTTSAGDDQKTE